MAETKTIFEIIQQANKLLAESGSSMRLHPYRHRPKGSVEKLKAIQRGLQKQIDAMNPAIEFLSRWKSGY